MAEDNRSDRQILLELEGQHKALVLQVNEISKAQERIFTSVFGIRGTENGGFIQSLNVARNDIRANHERIEGLETNYARLDERQKPSRKKQAGFLGTVITAMGGILYGLGSRLGWW